MRKGFTLLALVILAGGCSKDFNTTNAARYYDAGTRAEAGRDYAGAEEHFERALVWAGTEKVPPAMLSLTMYNLGRMKGHGCKFEDARELLLTSLALEEQTSGPASSQVSRRLFELARLSYDRRRYAEALPYYAQAIPMVRQLKLENEDPLAFTDALSEYATSLRLTGDVAAANIIAIEVNARRAQHPDARPQYVISRYTPSCRGSAVVLSGRA